MIQTEGTQQPLSREQWTLKLLSERQLSWSGLLTERTLALSAARGKYLETEFFPEVMSLPPHMKVAEVLKRASAAVQHREVVITYSADVRHLELVANNYSSGTLHGVEAQWLEHENFSPCFTIHIHGELLLDDNGVDLCSPLDFETTLSDPEQLGMGVISGEYVVFVFKTSATPRKLSDHHLRSLVRGIYSDEFYADIAAGNSVRSLEYVKEMCLLYGLVLYLGEKDEILLKQPLLTQQEQTISTAENPSLITGPHLAQTRSNG